ncbi:hypothetical protein C8J57DRAFT_1321581, partial [Mycena rebaudengoi]
MARGWLTISPILFLSLLCTRRGLRAQRAGRGVSRLVSLFFFVFGLGSSFGVGLARDRTPCAHGGPLRPFCLSFYS